MIDYLNNKVDVYEGDWKNGLRQGKGKLIFNTGKTYEGDFILDKMEGRGILKGAAFIYEGEFANDKMDGKGKYIITAGEHKGDSYDGEWYKGISTDKEHINGLVALNMKENGTWIKKKEKER
jgi:hypothetical protein